VGDHTKLVAQWREREVRLETGLDRELARRLDDLRAEHAQLVFESPQPRFALVRTVDPPTSPAATDGARHRETPPSPAVASVHSAENGKPSSPAARRRH
jgi:hypothetical protein